MAAIIKQWLTLITQANFYSTTAGLFIKGVKSRLVREATLDSECPSRSANIKAVYEDNCIRGAKGGKDRVVSLPSSLVCELAQQLELARGLWRRDQQNAIPVMLPQSLDRKYPEYQFSWPRAWLFAAVAIGDLNGDGILDAVVVNEVLGSGYSIDLAIGNREVTGAVVLSTRMVTGTSLQALFGLNLASEYCWDRAWAVLRLRHITEGLPAGSW